MALAPTQYARSGDADIAYQVIGGGPVDLVLALDWANHLEAVQELPYAADFVQGLGRSARVLWFDMRGTGMSRNPSGDLMAMEAWIDDLVAVMDATGSERAAIVAHGYAVQMAIMAAATRPERVLSLVLVNGFARFGRSDDYPIGMPKDAHEKVLEMTESVWGTGAFVRLLMPSLANRPGVQEWWGRVERYGATPRLARERYARVFELDVRDLLPLVHVPVLIVHSDGDTLIRLDHGRYLAEHVPGARLVTLDAAGHWPPIDAVALIGEFVTGVPADPVETDRSLATVLFVDIVGSTEYASVVGDRSWQAALSRFEEVVRKTLALYEGRLESTTGDGILATFDGPARAIRCAEHIRDQVRLAGLAVRCGQHTGEVTRRTDDISGLAVHIGARVSALAQPDEVLVTRTVRDLVSGSGITFEERGEHELRGIPDRWALYAALG
jgi:class 3 adenylate cyclase